MMHLQRYAKLRPYLFHNTDARNLTGIRAFHRLISPSAAGAGFQARRHTEELRRWKGQTLLLRDQRPLQFGHVEFEGGWTRADLLAALADRVFFWPGDSTGPIPSARRLALGYPRSVFLRVELTDLLLSNPGNEPQFCKFNSGGPRTTGGRKSPRGPSTFQVANDWQSRCCDVVEVCFRDSVKLPSSVEVSIDGNWAPL